MRLIQCETYQGSIAAAHVEYPTRELHGGSEAQPDPGVISPVIIDQSGEIAFLSPVETADEAIAVAKAQIERNNRAYVDHVLDSRVPADNAVQHFQDCGIPLEIVPPLPVGRPYYPGYPTPFSFDEHSAVPALSSVGSTPPPPCCA